MESTTTLQLEHDQSFFDNQSARSLQVLDLMKAIDGGSERKQKLIDRMLTPFPDVSIEIKKQKAFGSEGSDFDFIIRADGKKEYFLLPESGLMNCPSIPLENIIAGLQFSRQTPHGETIIMRVPIFSKSDINRPTEDCIREVHELLIEKTAFNELAKKIHEVAYTSPNLIQFDNDFQKYIWGNEWIPEDGATNIVIDNMSNMFNKVNKRFTGDSQDLMKNIDLTQK